MLFIPKSYAHVHERSGDISALIHITPDDKPVANEDAVIHLGIQDNNENIYVPNCSCTVSIKKDGEEVLKYKIVENFGDDATLYNAYVPLKFPSAGAYDIVLSGTVHKDDEHKEFSLNFATYVEEGQTSVEEVQKTQDSFPITLAACILAVILIILLYIVFIRKKKR